MKKLKILGIAMGVFLVLTVAALAILAALGIFTVTPGENGGISLNPISFKKEWEITVSEETTAVLVTEQGEIEIGLSETDAAEKFVELIQSGEYDKAAFDMIADELFISASADGESFETEKNPFACVYGAVGFVTDGEKASPEFFIVTNNDLSGLSESFMNEQGFEEEKIELYKNLGGIPEYEGKVVIFGKVISDMKVVENIAKTENSGYTDGYKALEPVKIDHVFVTVPATDAMTAENLE